ncbi:type II secretion system F family protein [Candidatus Woesearchaeota archaeon]|nr:type II secretion system F family protein [Candidatus Woesearchaeota archaeon]
MFGRKKGEKGLAEEKFGHGHLKKEDVMRRKKLFMQPKRSKGLLKHYLEKAGVNIEGEKVSRHIFRLAVFLNLLLSVYLIYRFSTDLKIGVVYVTLVMVLIWVFAFVAILFLVWLFLFIMLDLRVFKRRIGIEEVLPDYLQLTSGNIRAGMPVDRALWYAVRPRFGVLANEIEMVAKETMSGSDLDAALRRFSDKYDSVVLKRSINLLIESYNAGGEVGDILNKISNNIKENQLMRKELAANVTTYAIFIGFATIIASPLLFALSGQLLEVIGRIMSTIDIKDVQQTAGLGFSFAFSKPGVSLSDFRIFAAISLAVTSFFSAAIIATIRKGDLRSGVKYFPVFFAITLILYFTSSFAFSYLLKGMF